MARNRARVLLGFEDECITDKNKSFVNFTTNKIGGKPDWPVDGISSPACQLCGLSLPLVVQVYAPLENSSYHRTLYLFACVNPNCWNNDESWVCLRSQVLESGSSEKEVVPPPTNTTDWCPGADEWDDDNNMNNNEENGNVIGCSIESFQERTSDDEDEDEETTTEEDDVRTRLGGLSVDERNANCGAGVGGAVGRLLSPSASAEIEGAEGEVVSIDTPTEPQRDLAALLSEAPPPPDRPVQFASFFVAVAEEEHEGGVTPLSEHVRDLLQEYQGGGGGAHPDADTPLEAYERSAPAHGDRLFHAFVTRIRQNPGQILRYCREGGSPLMLRPAPDIPTRCEHCQGELLFELQVLPTLIPRLRLVGSGGGPSHLEFGTVLVWTCRRSCWTVGDTWRLERVLVQAERP